ncbi:MAG: response regulator [Myxococcales bacterium]|nr:response regulator [Myxococcales bacterium]
MTSPGGAAGQSPAVLVVDDEPNIRHILGKVVRTIGAEPVLADSASQARELLSSREYVCALVDKNLLDGSGMVLLKSIKEDYPATEVIIISGYASVESAIEALHLGAFDYLQKPIDIRSLVDAVRTAIDPRRAITRNPRIGAVLAHADRLAAVGTLAAGAAHEINNPLAYILANTEYAIRELQSVAAAMGEADPARARLRSLVTPLEENLEGGRRIKHIVRGLSRFAREDVSEPTGPVNVEVVLDQALAIASNQTRPRARVVRQFGHPPPALAGDRLLAQVFLNLVVNAAQSIGEGRPLENEIRVVTRSEPPTVIVEIIDTGCGIGPEIRDRIFDPFFTTKPVDVGTGLGLSICHGIVSSLKGQIEVESELGRGTLMRVRLPAAQVSKAAAPSEPCAAEVHRVGGRIMVVDDEPWFLASVGRILTPDHQVVAYSSVTEALAHLEGDRQFDLILCDVYLPEMTGTELFALLSARWPELEGRILFVTGGAFTPEAVDFLMRRKELVLEKTAGSFHAEEDSLRSTRAG